MQARSTLTAIALAIAPCSAFGFSDFNGDGRSDLLWRNHSTGANVIWLSANSATLQAVTAVINLDWRVVGLGDYNGDGRRRHPVAQHQHRCQRDLAFRQLRHATGGDAVTNLAWQVVGSGDYNGDGKADILWRNSAPVPT